MGGAHTNIKPVAVSCPPWRGCTAVGNREQLVKNRMLADRIGQYLRLVALVPPWLYGRARHYRTATICSPSFPVFVAQTSTYERRLQSLPTPTHSHPNPQPLQGWNRLAPASSPGEQLPHQQPLRFQFRCHGSVFVPVRSHMLLLRLLLLAALPRWPQVRGHPRHLNRRSLLRRAFRLRFRSMTPPERPASCLPVPLRTQNSNLVSR